MPRANPLQPAFNAGELSPRMSARVDFDKYASGCATLQNMLPLPQGGIMRRSGTRFIAEVKDSSKKTYVRRFEFSTEQAYVLEVGHQYFRFYRHQGRIIVPDTDAAITNGTFDSNITGWDDRSTGSASISHLVLTTGEQGTFNQATAAGRDFGAGGAGHTYAGFKFRSAVADSISMIRAEVFSVVAGFDDRAQIYTDNAGSPGTQVGTNSATVTLSATGIKEWIFATPVPVDADTSYWVVLTDITGTTGNIKLATCADQGSSFASGRDNTAVTSIADQSDAFPSAEDWRIGITTSGAQGRLRLNGAGSDVAWAEQDVTTTNINQEHVLKLDVIGAPGDSIELRIGEVSQGGGLVNDLTLGVGSHAIAFTPTASPFYVQFRNKLNKTVLIDDVSLIDEAPVEVETPYGEDDLAELRFAQSADVLYIAHPDYPTYKLSRRGHTTWSLTEVAWQDGPYLDQNQTGTTLTPSAGSGKGVTVTASATTGINDGDGFKEKDVGRLVRVKNGTDWAWGVVVGMTDTTHVRVDHRGSTNFPTTATTDWNLGAWSGITGYPAVIGFFEQRLAAARTFSQPQTFWMSQSADLENMQPDDGSDVVEDDDALNYTFSADQVNAIQWISSGRQFVMGTSGGAWVAESDGPVVTPTDIQVRRHTTVGSANKTPVRVDDVVLFLQRAQRKINEFAYVFEADGYRAPDLTILADHITRGRVADMAYQPEPHSVVWIVRTDGTMLSMTYRRDQKVIGWARHQIGGMFSGGSSLVDSVATIPGDDGPGQPQDSTDRDELWIIVKRTINGETKRYVEVFERDFEGPISHDYSDEAAWEAAILTAQKAAYYADSLLTYEGAATNTISGLGHLEGETVKILANGAVHPDRAVSAGQIALDYPASRVQVGLSYAHRFQSLKMTSGAAAGTALGKVKRIHGVTLLLLDAATTRIGPSFDKLKDIAFRTVGDAMDTAVPLFSGEYHLEFDGDYGRDVRICIEGDAPAPFTLIALAPELKTNEMV